MPWGATPQEWTHFSAWLGLTADLLPVVSNPTAQISPHSAMRSMGKTPSRYNQQHNVVGFPNWTSHRSDSNQVNLWSREPDYGICLQTRLVRALDIDIPDILVVQGLLDAAAAEFPWILTLPRRIRENSGKMLLAFTLPGEYAKRVAKTESGIIEFLATGQQFVAVGTHPSGAKYEWEGGLPEDLPEVEPAQFEKLWAFLVSRYAVEKDVTRGGLRKNGEDLGIEDPIVEKLEALGYGPEGQVYIRCPFESEHTSDTGPAATAYFPAGTRGYQKGHFRCLHAHCSGRTDEDFLDALGLRAGQFDVIALPEDGSRPLPAFKRKGDGTILPTINNLIDALNCPDFSGWRIHYDTFRDDLLKTEHPKTKWSSWKETDYTTIMAGLERKGFAPLGIDMVRRAVARVGELNECDSALEWLKAQEWDGIDRAELFLASYFGAEDNPYTRAVSRYIWTALAGRILEPGCKADMMPILQGAQGIRKSTAIAALPPARAFFCEMSFDEKDDNLSRKMRSCMVAEFGELRGITSREADWIKAWVAKTHEEWTPKYQERTTVFPRRALFFGTTNDDEILSDPTGNRRWLPVRVKFADVERIKRDREQLWAEGAEMFSNKGIDWSAEKLAQEAHSEFRVRDPWEDVIAAWLGEPDLDGKMPYDYPFIPTSELLVSALGITVAKMTQRDVKRLAAAMRALGYTSTVVKDKGVTKRAWIRK